MSTNKTNKYLYGWKLFVDYGNGPEYEYFAENKKSYTEQKKIYLKECSAPQKWSRGRMLNPTWINEQKKHLKLLIELCVTCAQSYSKEDTIYRLSKQPATTPNMENLTLKDIKNAVEIVSEYVTFK